MKKISRRILELAVRYGILIAVALPNFWLFYAVFTPLTLYSADFILSLFYETSLSGNLITISGCFPIEIIGACVGASAYYLLLILNFSTPEISAKKRAKILLTSFAAFLILNLARILLLSALFVSGSSIFGVLHKIFWYALSTLFVVGIWFAEVRIFRIKKIPFYSDIKFLKKLI